MAVEMIRQAQQQHEIEDSGNVIAALCSFFVPDLGKLLQGRLGMAIVEFVLAALLWFVFLGWIGHLWSILDAAKYSAP